MLIIARRCAWTRLGSADCSGLPPPISMRSETHCCDQRYRSHYKLRLRCRQPTVQLIEAFGSGVARTTTTSFDSVGNTLSVVNPRGITTSYGYDLLNRQITRMDAFGSGLQRTLTTTFDAVGNTLSVTNGLGVTSSFGYDALNRRITQLDAFGTGLQRATTMAYDPADNLTTSTDALGFITTFDYDALDRRVSITNPDGGVSSTIYDPNSNVVNSIDQLSHTSTYVYDVLNRKTQAIDARGGIVTLVYDANNNLSSLTDPIGNQTQWVYDLLNRQVLEADPLSNVSTMAYDAVERATSASDKNGQLIAYAYDLLNREIGEAWYDISGTQVNLLTFTFDPNNNLLAAMNNAAVNTLSYDTLDRLTTMQDSFGTLQRARSTRPTTGWFFKTLSAGRLRVPTMRSTASQPCSIRDRARTCAKTSPTRCAIR